MNSIKLLETLLKSQKLEGVKSKDWDKLNYEIREDGDGIQVIIPSVSVGFSFNHNGNFKGIFNYKW